MPSSARNHSNRYVTRQTSDLRPEYQRLSLTQKSIFYAGPSAWNNLPLEIRNIEKKS